MSRSQRAAWASTQFLLRRLPRGRLLQGRQRHAQTLAQAVAGAPRARVWGGDATQAAPYVLPVWVDHAATADAVYARLRSRGVPVFRWDERWPGATLLNNVEGHASTAHPGNTQMSDHGIAASRHLLQVPTHADYTARELALVARELRQALEAA